MFFQPFPWFRAAYFVIWSCVYVTVQWILHACGMSWYGQFTPSPFFFFFFCHFQSVKYFLSSDVLVEELFNLSWFSPRWPYPFLDLDTPWAPLWYNFAIVFVNLVSPSVRKNLISVFNSQVLLHGCSSHPLLWDICTTHKSEKFNSPQTVSPCFH